jgi:hypothetical protein
LFTRRRRGIERGFFFPVPFADGGRRPVLWVACTSSRAAHARLSSPFPQNPPREKTTTTATACCRRLAREVKTVFPGLDTTRLLVVPTFQRASAELLSTSEAIDAERDRLLERVRFLFFGGVFFSLVFLSRCCCPPAFWPSHIFLSPLHFGCLVIEARI